MTGAELRAVRRRLGLTQAAFAAILDVSRGQVINWEQERWRQNGRPIDIVPRVVELATLWLVHTRPPAPAPHPGRQKPKLQTCAKTQTD